MKHVRRLEAKDQPRDKREQTCDCRRCSDEQKGNSGDNALGSEACFHAEERAPLNVRSSTVAAVDNGHANPPLCGLMYATRCTTTSQQEPIRATST